MYREADLILTGAGIYGLLVLAFFGATWLLMGLAGAVALVTPKGRH